MVLAETVWVEHVAQRGANLVPLPARVLAEVLRVGHMAGWGATLVPEYWAGDSVGLQQSCNLLPPRP